MILVIWHFFRRDSDEHSNLTQRWKILENRLLPLLDSKPNKIYRLHILEFLIEPEPFHNILQLN